MSKRSLRRKTYDFLELGSFGSRAAVVFDYFMIALIVANVAAVALETVPALWQAYGFWFHLFDIISVTIFTLEYGVRVWSAAERNDGQHSGRFMRRLRYMATPLAIIDLLAILPSFLGLGGSNEWRVLRIFRLLRLLKLVRYSPALSSLSRVIMAERRALFATLIIMMGLMFLSATIMYLIEKDVQPDAFGDIPSALWWALTTLTTVGYGDVVPVTPFGQVFGGIVMVFGLAFYALPIGIIASGFSDEVHRHDFILPARVIEDFPLFQGLGPEVAQDIAARVRAVHLMPGTVLTHRMDQHNGLYCILSGQVSAFYAHAGVPLEAGDFLGECSIITEHGLQPSSVIQERAKLMWLESVDLHMLIAVYPVFVDNLLSHARARLNALVKAGYVPDSAIAQMMHTLETRLHSPK